jgi:hypothetical protein
MKSPLPKRAAEFPAQIVGLILALVDELQGRR